MSYPVFPIFVNDHMGHPSCRTVDIHLITGFDRQANEHDVPYAQEIPVRDYDDVLFITRHHFVEKRLKTVPGIASALGVGKQPVIYGLLGMLNVPAKPFHGFAATLSEVSFSEFLPEDRFCPQMLCDGFCRLFCPLQI